MATAAPARRSVLGALGQRSNLQAPVLLAGLLASVSAGVVAWRIVGPYGDGPFGAGFRRIPAISANRPVLVRDLRGGAAPVRAIIDDETGRVSELQMGQGGGFATVSRIYIEETGGARVPHDTDGDGITDRWDYYADLRQIERGAVQRVGFSMAGDGIADAWAFHDEQGRVSRVEISTARDGVVDRWEHYSSGTLVHVEIDADRDGRVDGWETWVDGILSAVAADLDGDGLPDPPAGGER